MVSSISGFGQFDASSISQMRQNFFNNLDQNSDGSIDKTEFATALQDMDGVSSNDIFSQLDTNGDSTISKDELSATLDKMDENMKKNPPLPPPMGMMGGNGQASASSDEEKDTEIFNSLDTNGDGYISATELSAAHDESTANKIMTEADTDNDGQISKSESDAFLASMQATMQAGASSSNLSSSQLNSLDEDLLSKIIDTVSGNSTVSSTSGSQNSLSADKIFSAMDTDNDGKISKDEFETFLKTTQSESSTSASSSNLALNDLNLFQQDLLSKMIESILGNSSSNSAASSKDSLSFYA